MLTSYCLQVQSSAGGPRKYSGPVSVVRSLHREGGLRSIFRGSAATAARGRNMLSDLTESAAELRRSSLLIFLPRSYQ